MERLLPMLGVIFVGYLAYDYYYSFQKSASSPLVQQKKSLELVEKESKGYLEKIKQAEEFNKTLEQKIAELRLLSAQLEEFKVTLSEDFDTGLYGALASESRRAGVMVSKFTKGNTKKTEFYDEVSYQVSFTAVYIQLFVFLDRISKLDKIVRIAGLNLHPINAESSESPYVELKGDLKLSTYRYKGTKADELNVPAKPAPGGKT